MRYYKYLGIILFLLLLSKDVYAEQYTVNGQVLAISQSGQYIPQYWETEQTDKNKAPKYRVFIDGVDRGADIVGNGKFKFLLNKKKYPPGTQVVFSVNKNDSKIVYPLDGKGFLPASGAGDIKLVLDFKEKQPLDIFAVQLLNTRDQTKAIGLRNNLAKDLAKELSNPKYKKIPVYIEEYMVANMPDNGFDYKVKIGDFNNKGIAVEFKKYLEKRYSSMQDLFITQKGLK